MPDLTPTVLGFFVFALIAGFVLGWILRGGRIRREKSAINASWQDQMSAQKTEHDRLADQNKSLMEQISQYRASKKDADMRAKELSDSLKETFERRDELQRQMKELRSQLDVAQAKRDKLRSELESGAVRRDASASALKEKDDKIFKLSRELESWQNRLPPLLERFRLRDLEAQELEQNLEKAEARISSLEQLADSGETRIEPVETNPIAEGMDASNDQYEETSAHDISRFESEDDDDADEIAEAHEAAEDHEEPVADESGHDDAQPEVVADADEQHEASGESSDDVADPEGFDNEFFTAAEKEDASDATAEDDAGEDLVADEQTGIDTYHAEGTVDFDLSGADFETLAESENHDVYSGPEADDEAGDESDDESDDDTCEAVSSYDSGADRPRINGSTNEDARDDLQQIKGVGPAIEKTLNDLGIYRFNQIAEMSEYDIDRVARELRGFRSRIYREDWIGQARSLQFEKTSTPA